MSKRSIGLILVLSMVMVIAFAGVAMAAQNKIDANGSETKGSYLPTPKEFSTTDGVYAYPNGIYLPNGGDPNAYRIHTNYAKNTDACAACHATHTAVGASLLQWSNVYEACMACHDGTVTTTYNVMGGEIGDSGDPTFAGLFGTGTAGETSSNHNVTGAVEIGAAPGGTTLAANDPDAYDPKHPTTDVAWETEFGCQSCHNPHGMGANARILNPNPNEQQWKLFNNGTTQDVPMDVYDAGSKIYTVDTDLVGNTGTKYFLINGGYPYSAVTAVYNDGTKLSNGAATNGYTISNANGDYSKIQLTADVTPGSLTAWFVPALKVKMTVNDYLGDAESVTHVSGLNNFCGACHTDYNTADTADAAAKTGQTLNGDYTEAYRHRVGMSTSSYINKIGAVSMPSENGKMTCETCHFAHGTNQDFWDEVQPTTGTGLASWEDEISGSSALKRLPNMATCERCHDKASGNEGYAIPQLTSTANVLAGQTGATFVGSTKCGECHANHKSGWETTRHKTMIQAFDPATAEASGVAMVSQADYEAFTAATLADGTLQDMNINVTNGAAAWNDIDYVVGTKRKQRFLFKLGTDADPQYRFATFEYYKNGSGSAAANGFPNWNQYSGKTQQYEDFCMNCHTTGLTVDANGYYTGVKEMGVSCESCHGAGSIHASAPSTVNIVNPAKLSYDKATDVCGSCHNRGWNKAYAGAGKAGATDLVAVAAVPGTVQREDFPNFKPGMSFGPLASLYFAPNNENGSQLLSMQNGGYATGHHEQYMEFKDSSKHYDIVNMTCSSCHSSHGKNSAGSQLKLSAGQTCGQCHGNTYDIATYMPLVAKQAGNNGKIPSHTFVVPGQTDPTWVLDGDK